MVETNLGHSGNGFAQEPEIPLLLRGFFLRDIEIGCSGLANTRQGMLQTISVYSASSSLRPDLDFPRTSGTYGLHTRDVDTSDPDDTLLSAKAVFSIPDFAEARPALCSSGSCYELGLRHPPIPRL